MIRAALAYVARGVHVFPCRGKIPLTDHGVKDAATDAEQIRQWWTRWPHANVAIACGASRLVVLDIDRKPAQPDGLETLAKVALAIPSVLPNTLTASTPSGGLHLYYGAPDGVKIRPTVGRLGRQDAPGVDVRAGSSYVVAPPSSIAGCPYTWANRMPPGELPPAWVDALREPDRPPPRRAPVTPPKDPDGARQYALAALIGEELGLADVPKGLRNHELVRAAFKLGGFVPTAALAAEEIEDALMRACNTNGLLADVDDGERKCLRTITNGIRAGAAHPREIPEAAA